MVKNIKRIVILFLVFVLILSFKYKAESLAYTEENIFGTQTIIIASEPSTPTGTEGTSTSSEGPSSSEEEGGVSIILMLKESVAKWYYVFREISIIVMLLVFIYLGIMMAVSTIASDKAKYKTMLIDWFVGFSLVFFIHYYMLGIISINEVLVKDFIPHLTLTEFAKKNNLEEADIKDKDIEYLSETQKEENEKEKSYSDAEVKIYETLRSRAYEIKASRAVVGTIMYALMVYLAIRFSIIYFVRLITIMILTVTAPFIALAFAIQKIMNGKSTIYSNWMREYAFTVLIQAIHAFIYVVFISAVLLMIEDTIAGIAIAFIILWNMIRADELVRALFPKQMPKESSLEENSKMNVSEKTKQVRGWGKSANRFMQRHVNPRIANGVANITGAAGANNMSVLQGMGNDLNNNEENEYDDELANVVSAVDMSYQNQAEEAKEDLEDIIDSASESEGNLENSRTETAKNVNEEIDNRIEKLEEQKQEQKVGMSLLQNETSKLKSNYIETQMAMPMFALYMNGKNANITQNITGYKNNNISNEFKFKGFSNVQTLNSVNPRIANRRRIKTYIPKSTYKRAKSGRKKFIVGASGRLSGSKKMIKMKSGNMYLERTDKKGKYNLINNIEEQLNILNESKNVSNAFFDGSMNRMREVNHLANRGNIKDADRIYQDYIKDMKTATFKLKEPMVTMALMNYLNKSNMTYAKNFSKQDINGVIIELNSIFQQSGFNGVTVGDGFKENLLDELYQDELQMHLDDEEYYRDVAGHSEMNIIVKENELVRENFRGQFNDFYRENQNGIEEFDSNLYQEKLFQLQNTINLRSQNILEDKRTIDGQELRDRISLLNENLEYAGKVGLNNSNQMEELLEDRLNNGYMQDEHGKFYSMDTESEQPNDLEVLRDKIKENNIKENSKDGIEYGNIYQSQPTKIENYMQEQDKIRTQLSDENVKENERYRRIRENAEERYQELLGNNNDTDNLNKDREKYSFDKTNTENQNYTREENKKQQNTQVENYTNQFNMSNMNDKKYMQEETTPTYREQTEEQRREEIDRNRRIRERGEERYQELLENNNELDSLKLDREEYSFDRSNTENEKYMPREADTNKVRKEDYTQVANYANQFNMSNMNDRKYMQEETTLTYREQTEEQRREEIDRKRKIREYSEERYEELLKNNKESENKKDIVDLRERDTSDDELNNRYKKIRELSENRLMEMQKKASNNKSDIEMLRDKIMNALNDKDGIEKQAIDPRNKSIIDSADQMEKINNKAKELKIREIFNINQDFRHLMEETNNNLGGGRA